MTRKELEGLVQGLADGTLDEPALSALQKELRESAAVRAFYRESMELELLLRESMDVRLPQVASGKRMGGLLRRRQRRSMGWALLAAAAVVLLSVAVLHRVFLKTPDSSIRIDFTAGTSWQGGAANGVLEPGNLMQVEFGMAEIMLPQGVRAVVEGPASFRVGRENDMDLLEGRAWFRIEKEARGFVLRTPQVQVTDLGTEFGVVTQRNALDEVHVFEGRVAVVARFGLKQEDELGTDQAAQVSPVGRWISREPDGAGFFKHLPPSLPGIFFSFDGGEPLQPEGVHLAVEEMAVERIGGGPPKLIDGIRGKALRVEGMDDVISTDWPGIGGGKPRTISCWIRCDPDVSDFSGIISWGLPDEDRPGRCKLLVAKSPAHGKLVARLSLGHHVHFSGSTPMEPGHWYHVAAVFRGVQSEGGDMVELYVDGRREQVDPEFSQPPKEDQAIGTVIDSKDSSPMRIGTGPEQGNPKAFRGAIDSVYLLPRALSQREIQGLMD